MSRRWAEIEEAFDRALDLQGEERDRFVDGLESSVSREVKELLSAGQLQGPLDSPGENLTTLMKKAVEGRGPGAVSPGMNIGPYLLLEPLGRGGMGRVFHAKQVDGTVDRELAIKFLRWEIADAESNRRFRRERQILARLEHPGIARLIDGGVTEDQIPFLAMEYVQGMAVTSYVNERGCSIEERLELFCQICDAVDYLHRNLVIHRDLKPSNVMMTTEGEVKLLDFGVAKILDAGSDDTLTGSQLAPMTPYYASPEQISGKPLATTSDVYSLGVILFELLTGTTPFVTTEETVSSAEYLRRIEESDPALPSERCRAEDASRIRGDLDCIVSTALRGDPSRRYPSAAALAQDIRRHLTLLPVEARADSIRYRAGRFVRRNRWPLTGAATVVLSLATGLATTLWQANRADRARILAEQEASKAQDAVDMFVGLFEVADKGSSPTDPIQANELLNAGVLEARAKLKDQPLNLAEMLLVLGKSYANLGLNREADTVFREAAGLVRENLGSDRTELGEILVELGNLCAASHDPACAYEALTEASEILETTSDREVLLARIAVGRARALSHLDRIEEANPLIDEAVAVLSERVEWNDPDLLRARGSRAAILRQHDRDEEASAEYETVLKIYRANGASPNDLASTLNNLAFLRGRAGNPSGAEPLFREALSILESELGDSHPTVMMARTNLVSSLYDQKKFQQSVDLLERNLRAAQGAYPPTHWRIGSAWSSIGRARLALGDFDRAAAAFASTKRIYSSDLGTDHIWTYTAELAESMARLGRGDGVEAQKDFDTVYRLLADRRSDFSVSDVGVLKAIAGFYRDWDVDTADRVLELAEPPET